MSTESSDAAAAKVATTAPAERDGQSARRGDKVATVGGVGLLALLPIAGLLLFGLFILLLVGNRRSGQHG
ncbi:MAG: hypothetical protein R3C10_04685 [Pirellulales bacterium]